MSEAGLKVVLHTHFKGWPDWEVPHKESLVQFKALISETADFVISQNQR